MSPLNSLRGRKKKEDLETMGQMPRQDQALLIIILLYYWTHSHNGGWGRVNLFAHKATAIVKLYRYS